MQHHVFNKPIITSAEAGLEMATFAMGCFWGAEKLFWQQSGVVMTSVGYAGSDYEDPTYEQVCSGLTGHAEAVQVIFNPLKISYKELLKLFWENHDPTQGMRQGNDIGTQYRSVIFTHSQEQSKTAHASKNEYQKLLSDTGYSSITTEIEPMTKYYLAEEYHQQYLSKNPGGYCGHGGTGVCFTKS